MNAKLKVYDIERYDIGLISTAVDDIFLSFNLKEIVKPGAKVFIKPNLIRDMPPQRAATTHPLVVQAVAKKLVDEFNAQVVIGDSSGGVFAAGYMNKVYKTTQMTDAAANSGASVNENFGSSVVDIDGLVAKKLDIIDVFTSADVVINICKMKTHSLTGFSGAVKNLFGLIPGLVKVSLHARFSDATQFVDCLIDIAQYASKKIVLHIMDGIVAMEGPGPTNGTPRMVGKLFAGNNPYYVDVAAINLFGDPMETPVIKRAVERKIISNQLNECDFDMAQLQSQRIADFNKVPAHGSMLDRVPKFMRKWARNRITNKVIVSAAECKSCKVCIEHCPAKTIKLVKGKAHIKQNKCIRCYCCQELCHFNAVKLKTPVLGKMFNKLSGGKKTKKSGN